MDLNTFFQSLTAAGFINFFFKAFAIVFSLMFFFYAVVFYKQAQEITNTIQGKNTGIIPSISFLQIILAVIILLFSFII